MESKKWQWVCPDTGLRITSEEDNLFVHGLMDSGFLQEFIPELVEKQFLTPREGHALTLLCKKYDVKIQVMGDAKDICIAVKNIPDDMTYCRTLLQETLSQVIMKTLSGELVPDMS